MRFEGEIHGPEIENAMGERSKGIYRKGGKTLDEFEQIWRERERAQWREREKMKKKKIRETRKEKRLIGRGMLEEGRGIVEMTDDDY